MYVWLTYVKLNNGEGIAGIPIYAHGYIELSEESAEVN